VRIGNERVTSGEGALPLEPGGGGFLRSLHAFSFNGERTAEKELAGLRYFVNEFWTSGQRQAHSIHEISYRACFKPQLPAFFIQRLTAPGDAVYDPFSGRGTTAVQAALMARRPIANDINPLSEILVRPRLDPPCIDEVKARLGALDLTRACPTAGERDLLVFYHPETLHQICALRRYLLERRANGRLDKVDEWIRMVAINRLTGHSSGFFSVYTLPPNQAVSIGSQRKINAARKQVPTYRDVGAVILKKTKSLLADGLPPEHPPGMLLTGPAYRTPKIGDGEVDLVVTSPPFLDIVDYEGDNWLRCWFAGIDAKSVLIDKHKDIRSWEAFVRETFIALARVVRPGGVVAFEVGEVRGGKVLLERHVMDALRGLPFAVLGVMVNQQEFTKTANCWGVSNNTHGTNTNRIVVAERISPCG
jgi:DNA methylase